MGRMQCFQSIRPYFEAVLAKKWVAERGVNESVPRGQLLSLIGKAAALRLVEHGSQHPQTVPKSRVRFDPVTGRLLA